jgi:hypothetical protein
MICGLIESLSSKFLNYREKLNGAESKSGRSQNLFFMSNVLVFCIITEIIIGLVGGVKNG